MLLYHPIEDSTHCCYRLIRLLYVIDKSIPITSLMICDFYSLFPGQLKKISGWPKKKSDADKIVQGIPNEYEEILNPKRVFFQLTGIQATALAHLKSKGIIEFSTSDQLNVHLKIDALPDIFIEILRNDSIINEGWFLLISKEMCKIPIMGKNGLKSKTGLMEFVYDK